MEKNREARLNLNYDKYYNQWYTLHYYFIILLIIISDLMDGKSCEGVLSQTRKCGLCKVTVLFLQKLRVFTTQEIAAYLIIGVKNVTTDIVEAFLKRKIGI